jgi:ribonuclease P protein component
MSARPGSTARQSKRGRLSRSAEFDRVFRQGRSQGNRVLVLYVFPRAEEGEQRMGVSVSRRVGGAVDRNRVKRLLREAFTQEADALPDGLDVVVVARPEARVVAERDGLEGIRGALAELIARVRERAGRDGR